MSNFESFVLDEDAPWLVGGGSLLKNAVFSTLSIELSVVWFDEELHGKCSDPNINFPSCSADEYSDGSMC